MSTEEAKKTLQMYRGSIDDGGPRFRKAWSILIANQNFWGRLSEAAQFLRPDPIEIFATRGQVFGYPICHVIPFVR